MELFIQHAIVHQFIVVASKIDIVII